MDKPAKLSRRLRPAQIQCISPILLGLWCLVWVAEAAADGPDVSTDAPAAVQANDAESKSKPQPAASSSGRPTKNAVQYVGPDTYILLDAEGHPQRMPGMTYEDFLSVWKKLNQPASQDTQRSYSIESVTFDGRIVDQRAELECRVKIRVFSNGLVRVPLGLVGAILQAEPNFNSTSANQSGAASEATEKRGAERDAEYLTYDSDNGGYVVNLSSGVGDVRDVTFQIVIPLQHDGAEITLPLNCPRTLLSQLKLHVSSAITEARVSGGTMMSQKSGASDGTDIDVSGLVGTCRLTWQAASQEAPAIGTILNALGAIHINVDGRGMRTDARLTVRSYGGAFDQFRVRLPVGAQLVQAASDATGSQYRIRVESDTSQNSSGKQETTGQVVVVELPEKQQGPIVVNLTTQQSGGLEARNQDISLGGFEVIGAVRQYGDIALTVSDDWQARWELGAYVRQVDPSELDSSLQSTNPTAAFQYDRQPWSTLVRIARRQLRVHVTPTYELECLPEEARLGVKLAYQVFGSRAFEFRVELNGWEMTGDPVESGSLVDQDRIVVTPEGTLLLPLSQASTRRAEVSFTLKRSLNRDATHLELPFPVPAADSIGTGELNVHSAPDVDLLPDLPGSTGLATLSAPDIADGTSADGATDLHYRTLLPAAIFVADRTSRTRVITTDSSTEIQVAEDSAHVAMQTNYLVRFEPIAELSFEVPAELSPDTSDLEIRLMTLVSTGNATDSDQGLLLHPVFNKEEASTANIAATRIVRCMLPRPGIGKFIAAIRYRIRVPISTGNRTQWAVPLIAPVDGRTTANRVTLNPPRGLAFDLGSQAEDVTWKREELTQHSAERTKFQFVASKAELQLPLVIHTTRTDTPAATVVDRVWLQTWLARDIEQDRAAYLIRSTGSQLTVELPPDVASNEVEVLVDRQPAEIMSRALGRLIVRLQSSSRPVDDSTAHTVELRWRRPYDHELLARHRFTPPQIDEGSTALSQLYWQIVLPGDEHIVGAPDHLVPAHEWQWFKVFWGHQPLKTQPELEEWVGATQQLAPSEGQNQYLYSGLLPVATIELSTAPRWIIVFIASVIVLAIACAWISVPPDYRLRITLAGCAVLALLAVAYPTAGLLAAQAAILGTVLSGIAFILARVRRRPHRSGGRAITSPSSQRMTVPRAESMLMPPFIATASTAPTASLRMPEPE